MVIQRLGVTGFAITLLLATVGGGSGAVFGDSPTGAEYAAVPGLVDLPAYGGRDFDRYTVPEVNKILAVNQSTLIPMLAHYNADRGALKRYFRIEISPKRRALLRQFYGGWLQAIKTLDFSRLAVDGQIDYVLFRNLLDYELRQLAIAENATAEIAPLIPFAAMIIELEERRVDLHGVDAEAAAGRLGELVMQISAVQAAVQTALAEEGGTNEFKELQQNAGNRAVQTIDRLRRHLQQWYEFSHGYEAEFAWWVEKPYAAADQALADYRDFIRDEIVQLDRNAIIGNPIGREALLSELAYEMIPYGPEKLIALAEQEFAWCEAEMRKAAAELGFGADTAAALEYVKGLHVQPGEQPAVIRDLAFEAVEFLEDRELVTVPELARNVWRMGMMSAERQRFTPFFTGGEVINVAFPTNEMTQDQKRMALRANNVHFSRATVQHELIPGHHLQGYMNSRNRSYRSLFRTPFSIEGWALYWEMLLWDEGFALSPENRIGMLFWRSHRCARIIFSLSYHLGTMTPAECIALLVDRVGHEPSTAEAEVRRSVSGGYGPLYQAAYLVGGLQFRALQRELVQSGKMTNREFHDAILKENAIPVEMVRAKLLAGSGLRRDFKTAWEFYK